MSWHNYESRIESLFSVPELLKKGVCVEYWDVSQITIPGYQVNYYQAPNGLKILKIESRKHFIKEIEARDNDDTLYLVFMNMCHLSMTCYHNLGKYNCKIIYCINGCIPNIMLNKSKFSFVKKILCSLNRHKIIKRTKDALYKLLSYTPYIPAVDYVLCTCEVARNMNVCKVNRFTKFINYNSGDYQRSIFEVGRSHQLQNKDYLVFIDQNIPFHPDNKLIGVSFDPTLYFNTMNMIFRELEKRFDKKIVIAAHPSCSERYIQNNYFEGREVFTGITMELVRDSFGVISHDSTAISFPVVFKKPLLFVFTESMRQSREASYQYCSVMSKLLDCPFIQEENNIVIPDNWQVNTDAYNVYKYSYLTNKDTENTSNGEILLTILTK